MQVYEEFVQMAKWQKRSGPGTGTKKTQEMPQLALRNGAATRRTDKYITLARGSSDYVTMEGTFMLARQCVSPRNCKNPFSDGQKNGQNMLETYRNV